MSFEKNNFIFAKQSVCSVSATDLKNNVSKTVFRKLCIFGMHGSDVFRTGVEYTLWVSVVLPI